MIPCRSIRQVSSQTGQPQSRTISSFCPAPEAMATHTSRSDNVGGPATDRVRPCRSKQGQ